MIPRMTGPTRFRLPAFSGALLLLAGCATVPQGPAATAPLAPVEIGIIALNDFHGTLEPPRRVVRMPGPDGATIDVPAGGAAWLASAIDTVRARHTLSVTVAAGDMESASQLSSSLFLDEPAVGVLNRMGLEYSAVGNHEFDRGWQELLRLQNGGCEKLAKREPCAIEPDYQGADYTYLAANVERDGGGTIMPGRAIKRLGSGDTEVVIGIVGLTLKGTDKLVSASGIEGIRFTDEAAAINRETEQLVQDGADALVVLIHEGILTNGKPDPNGCEGAEGDLLPILEKLDPRIDVVISGHTHVAHICDWQSADGSRRFLLTSAGSHSMLVTDITLTIDPARKDVIAGTAVNIPVQSEPFREYVTSSFTPQFSPREDVAKYIKQYVAAAWDYASRPVGTLAGLAEIEPASRLIADGQLNATRAAGAQIAFMNPFGVRAPLEPDADGTVTFGDIYDTQPFGGSLVTFTLRGDRLLAMLESQIDDDGPKQVLNPSEGLRYRYDMSRPAGARVFDVTFNGAPIDSAADYRITTSDFLADGGDSFSILTEGTDRVIGMTDIEALEAWLDSEAPRAVPLEPRAVNVPPGR